MNQKHLLFAGLGLVLVLGTGCGPDIAGTCEAQEACFGGNDADIDACIASYEGARDTAHGIGCGDEFDTLAACTEPLLQCTSNPSGGTCTQSSDCGGNAICNSDGECEVKAFAISDADACEAERNALSRCN
ncbi:MULTISPECIES: hypothetical protein [Polyangium]|uniref:Uncharacterized protein n=2 Tax=Polyangium TaxID=55 RepID=A0A4U1IP05_9BACT|nr:MULTISPECIES: hypothetical protein [Polyangium]MDI1436742.1 hypothetical protein [Polyangium sorediatum]TKC95874.1 hypothetical protein E8A74_46095 [Polyangium fumosum]